ncbi:MAG TPA: transglycosylase [Ktedonobacteraceae bacterium]|nr:transglycosylase [Ktedonobacteraceae bacterium]
MLTLLAEVPLITINLGNLHLALYLSQLMYLLVAALVGFVAEFIVGWRLPFGIIGAIIAALVGIWIVSNVIVLIIPGDPVLFGVPLFKALIGATIFAALWYLLTYRLWHHRRPYYSRRAPA